MTRPEGWLDEIVAAADRGEPTLVVCRTGATVRAVHRALAGAALSGPRRAWAGLEVASLGALVAAAAPHCLGPDPGSPSDEPLPRGHPWKALLEERPGLRRSLRAVAERLHAASLAGAPLRGLSRELALLLRARWAVPESLEGARRLLASRPPDGRRTFAVGFAPGRFSFLGQVGPLERALLSALGARPARAGDPTAAAPGPIPAARLWDPIAEARLVAHEAARAAARGERALVLVPDLPTEERVQAALRRNGIAVADDGAQPLSRHGLVSAIAPLVPLFASRGQAPLEASALLRLFTDPVLSRRPPPRGIAPVDGVPHPRASVRHVRDLLGACRRSRATLAEWRGALEVLEASSARRALERARRDEPDAALAAAHALASARVLLARLRALEERARGGGTLGDLAALIEDLGLAAPGEDRHGRAVIQALQQSGTRAADAASFAEALAGAMASGRVDEGVEILAYAAYDGRDCGRLLLTGVHDKGLASASPPDPFLAEADRQALGLAGAAQAVEERLSLARWAASRAASALALVPERDAAGRRVAVPVGLWLAFDDSLAVAPYGLDLPLPENADLSSLGPGEPGGEGLAPRDRTAVQVDAEWARAGALLDGAAVPDPSAAAADDEGTLLARLASPLARAPADLRPFLGEAGRGLPEGYVLSATRLQAFTSCLYRAYCQSVLRLRPPDEMGEDLDAREVGTAVHRALERSLRGVRLAAPDAEVEAERRSALARLEASTGEAVEALAAERPAGDSAPLKAARAGLASRWRRHFAAYVQGRIEPSSEHALRALRSLAALRGEPMDGLLRAVAPWLGARPSKDLREAIARTAVARRGEVGAVLSASAEIASSLARLHQARVAEALRGPLARPLLEALCARIRAELGDLGFDPAGDLEVVALEQPFGEQPDGAPVPSLSLALGRVPQPVRGKIDAVVRRRGDGGVQGTVYRVIDFKTGRSPPEADDLQGSLLQPQLALYALALQAGGALDPAHPGPVAVERGELDFVRAGKVVPAPLDPAALRRAARIFGALLDRARDGSFPLAPHPRGCPLLAPRGARCDFAELCRLRPSTLPEAAEAGAP